MGRAKISIGPLNLSLYGLLVVAAIFIGAYLAERLKDKREASVWDGLCWCLVGGILGARLYHVLDFWEYYSSYPAMILAVWNGGLGILGGILGGIVGLFFYCRRSKLNFWHGADLAVLGVSLGQAIGRWGNYFNQELYGWPTNLPWGIYIKPENRLWPVKPFEYFHPLFLYESLGCFLIFLALLFLKYKVKKCIDGELFFLYIFLYGLLRFFLEPLRIESWEVYGVKMAQLVCVVFMAAGLVGIVYKRKKVKFLFQDKEKTPTLRRG